MSFADEQFKERKTENRERKTENRRQKTENRVEATGHDLVEIRIEGQFRTIGKMEGWMEEIGTRLRYGQKREKFEIGICRTLELKIKEGQGAHSEHSRRCVVVQ